MKKLIRLKTIKLNKLSNTQLPDGDYTETRTLINEYKVIIDELSDNVSVEIYGADLDKMIRLSSVNGVLETFLKSKLNNTSDNVSKYEIEFENIFYDIMSVRPTYIDCKRNGKYISTTSINQEHSI